MFSLYTGNFFTNLHSYANFLISSSLQGFGLFYFAATQLLQSVCPDREMAVCAPVMSTMASVLTYDVVDTPMGPFTLGASDFAIHSAYFGKPSSVPAAGSDDHHQRHPVLALAKEQVQQYFAGQRKTFSVPVELQGTLFQRKAWAVLNMIPYGETWTYTEQAEGMGEHGKARAVGMANSKNPVCLLVPCHRVVGKGGNLRGYAFGVDIKQSLLEFEASHLSKSSDN